jgi:hypothetical protein
VTSNHWRAAFEAQCTAELLNKARRYATRRARKLRQVGGLVDDYYVREIVQDVVADTFAGVLRWDPEAEALEDHVLDAIATRVHHDVVRARRFPHASVDDANPDVSRATMAAVDAALLAAQEAPSATVRFLEDAFGEMCELAASDADLLRFLGALAMGATSKDDVMLVTGMSDPEYRSTRGRLERLIQRSPHGARQVTLKKPTHVARKARELASSMPVAGLCQVSPREPHMTPAREPNGSIPPPLRGPQESGSAHGAHRV